MIPGPDSLRSSEEKKEETEVSGSPMHWSGNRMLWDRRKDVVELFGNAVVNRPGETLRGDYIRLDLEKRVIDAKGDAEYVAQDTSIRGEELHINLDTGSGIIINGQVSNGRFLLVGERINRLSETRYQTHKAEYTTCHDCPASWTIAGKDVEMEVEGYAHLHDVRTKIKDAPFAWLPYMVVPIKTRRQTGFLFPRLGGSALHGFVFVQPFFWAMSRSTDMTFGLGTYSERGRRHEWEGRYAIDDGNATAQIFWTRDGKDDAPQIGDDGVGGPFNRWGLNINQRHEWPLDINQRLKITEVSDNLYPVHYSEDIEGRGEPVIANQFIASRADQYQSSFVEARVYRNLLNDSPVSFDKNTVQLLPHAEVTTNDRFLFGTPVASNLALGVSNFTRLNKEGFDNDTQTNNEVFEPGIDPVRAATRFSVTPKLYTAMRLYDVVSVIPSVQYKHYHYDFRNLLPGLNRGYLLFQLDLTAQLERYFTWNDPEVPKTKHLIRPMLRYNRIPYKDEPNHGFIRQIEREQGYKFDNEDIVPLSTSPSLVNYFDPLGNSISYGFTTQVIRRFEDEGMARPVYERVFELAAGQTFNFLELKTTSDKRVPLSRVFATKEMGYRNFNWFTQYYYYPYVDRLLRDQDTGLSQVPYAPSPHELTTSITYAFEREIRQYVLEFERSVSLNYSYRKLESPSSAIGAGLNYSINDYIIPSVGAQFDFITHRFISRTLTVNFQSPSRCWKLVTSIGRTVDQGLQVNVEFALNLTGERFGGLDEI